MTILVQPQLVNDPFDDAGLYADFRFGKRALLFDLGDLQPLPARKLLRVSHVFVSHAHMDHFSGFDRLLAVCLGRGLPLELFGPPGFVDRVEHKLAAYSWNLVAGNEVDFVIRASDVYDRSVGLTAEFHSRESFRRRQVMSASARTDSLLEEEEFRVRATTLDHGIPCLAFLFEERLRINIWKNRLARLGLPVGPWLGDLKKAVRRGEPDETPIAVPNDQMAAGHRRQISLGELKAEVIHIRPGGKLAYVVDAAYHEDNVARIIELTRNVEQLFIEAAFLEEDGSIAARKRHLTATQAGSLARRAGAKRVIPFHFSPRYLDRPDALRYEVQRSFAGNESE